MSSQLTRLCTPLNRETGFQRREAATVAIDPHTLMIHECMSISSAMRKASRLSQGGMAAILRAGDLFGEDDTIAGNFGFNSGFVNNGANEQTGGLDNPLVAGFIQLRSILTDNADIYTMDSLTLLQPFLLVIRSSTTSGYITSLALNSLSKFLHYGVISKGSKSLQNTLIQIISALTHCRFEAADQSSDVAVLLKVLRLLEYIIESDFCLLLPNEVISEVVQTCLILACNKKRSEVLRKAAEMAMTLITARILLQLKYIEPEKAHIGDFQSSFSSTNLPEDTIGGTEISAETPVSTNDAKSLEETATNKDPNTNEPNGTSLKDITTPQQERPEDPFNIICINEFLGILISIISPSNQYQHMESTRVFALSLINTAIEVSGDEFPKHISLMNLIADPISKHVLQIITSTDSPTLLQTALYLFTSIVIVLGKQLRSQTELAFTLLFNLIMPEKMIKKDKIDDTHVLSSIRSPRSKEIIIESISLLWIRSPTFFTDFFIKYDCNFDSTDLAANLVSYLCRMSLPESAIITTDHVPPICLEGLLSFIGGVNDRIKSLPSDIEVNELSTHRLLQNKRKKTTFIACTKILNENPKKGVEALIEHGFIKDGSNKHEIAEFFYRKSGRLNKKVLGEFLVKTANKDLLNEFINLFDFYGMRVDEALRVLLKAFRLPGESQQIERVVELFADRFVECQGQQEQTGDKEDNEKEEEEEAEEEETVTLDRDCVFVLSYSIIMLNTDLHSPQVRKQMDLEAYKRNLRGVYNGSDLPSWYLSKIYMSIKEREIIMPEEHHGTEKWFDDVWHNLISTSGNNISSSDEKFDLKDVCQFDKALFEVSIDLVIDTLVKVFKEASEDHIVTRLMSTIDKCTNICLYYDLPEVVDKLIFLLSDLTTIASETENPHENEDNVREEIPITQIKLEDREDPIVVSELAVWFGKDFKAQISTVVLFRLMKKADFKVTGSWIEIIKIIIKLFENCLIDPNFFTDFQTSFKLPPLNMAKPKYIINRLNLLKDSGIFSTFSSFLKGYSDSPPEPTEQEVESTLSTVDCINSLNISTIFEALLSSDCQNIKIFVSQILTEFPQQSEDNKRVFETELLFLAEATTALSLQANDVQCLELIVEKLFVYLDSGSLSKKCYFRLSSYVLILMMHCSTKFESALEKFFKKLNTIEKEMVAIHGSVLLIPIISLPKKDHWCSGFLINNEYYWKLLKTLGSVLGFAPDVFSLAKSLVDERTDAISEKNFLLLLSLLDEISSLGAIGAQLEHTKENQGDLQQSEIEKANINRTLELSKASIMLTTELIKVLQRDFSNKKEMCISLIQALAHQCFNPCREIRSFAMNNLQNTVLSLQPEQKLTSFEVFKYGLFPLIQELSKPEVLQTDLSGFSSTRSEVLSLLAKVFLKFNDSLTTKERDAVWLEILDTIVKFNTEPASSKPDSLVKESALELLKNMILVLQTSGVLTEENEEIWTSSWIKIEQVYPNLKDDLCN